MKRYLKFLTAISLFISIFILCACNNGQNQTSLTETTLKSVENGHQLDLELNKFNKLGAVSPDLSNGEIEYKTTDSDKISDFTSQITDSTAIEIGDSERLSGGMHFVLYNDNDILYHIYYEGEYFSVSGFDGFFKSENYDESKIFEIYNTLINR